MKRAYGSEPILLAASPVRDTRAPQPPNTRRPNKQQLFIVCTGIALLALASTYFIVRGNIHQQLIPTRIVQNISFPLYQPVGLPRDFFIDQRSFDATTQVVAFTINDAKGRSLLITEQPQPPQNSMDSFYSQQLTGVKNYTNATGNIVSGQYEGSFLAGIATGKTWILVRAVSTIDRSQFEAIIQQFERVR